MPNSTRRSASGRADVIEMFSPHRSGPWRLLHILHTKQGFLVLAVATLLGYAFLTKEHHHTLAVALLVTAVVLLVLSFKFLWELTGLLIRARAELFLLTVGEGLNILITTWIHTLGNIILLALVGLLICLPVTRRYLMGRLWCVIDRHRLRLCLRQTKVRTMNMDGSLPLLLWAHPTKTGERVYVWTRAGSNGEDIESAVSYIASACYAREARVHTRRKLTTLVTIEIIRRDPLSTPEPILSVLAKYIPQLAKDTTTTTEGTDPLSPVSIDDITNTTVSPDSIVLNGRTSKTKKPVAVTVPAPAAPATGEDFSDYID